MMSAQTLSLDGTWEFQVEPRELGETPPDETWRPAAVPMPWQAQFDDLRQTSGVAWYRRHFELAPEILASASEQAAVLHFGAVDYHATVWLNGQLIGEHEGGYLFFEFEVLRWLRPGDNELLVHVADPTDEHDRFPGIVFGEVPHGKQSWYGPISGLWQSVWLEFRPRPYIVHIKLDPRPIQDAVAVQVWLSEPPPADWHVSCTVTDAAGQTVGSASLPPGLSGLVQLDRPAVWWSPQSPALYTVTAALYVQGALRHVICQTCGFRTVEAREGRIYLNGQPIYLRGALDQAYYPETIYTPPSLNFLEAQARTAKALGFNCFRLHVKVEDPRYFDVADRLGLLIWAEIPSWARLTDLAAERAEATFREMVERDGHHPSIIAWTLVNENWGTDLSRNPAHRHWLAAFYRTAKALDPTRLVVDNSACAGNAHVASDLEDFHQYCAIPDHAAVWEAWTADFAGRPDWAWYPDFAAERCADLPLLVSEFGNWGLPDPETLREHGQEPWWFETGWEWEGGIVYPHGVAQRFEACGLAEVFPSFAEFARQAQEHQARCLHYEITSLRGQAAIAGYVVTEFTDVHWECNGLLTMQRQPKHRLDPLLKDLNQDRVVLLRPARWSGRPGAALDVAVQTMGVSGVETHGVIHWRAGRQADALPAPGGTISVALEAAGVVTLSARWQTKNGAVLATNQVDLVCVDTAPPPARLHVVASPVLADALRHAGHAVSEGEAQDADGDEIVVADRYTEAVAARVQGGGRVVWLAGVSPEEGGARDVPLPIGQIVPRAGTAWQGDWATCFAWIKKQGSLSHLPGSPLLEMEWAPLMPDAVLTGLPSWMLRSHSYAGLAVGWVHRPVSLLAVIPYGHGQLLLTTFRLNANTLADDALTQALFAGMLNLL